MSDLRGALRTGAGDSGGSGDLRSRRRSLLVCSSAVFIVMLDGSIVNVALPSIGRALGAGTAGMQWVTDGYLLVLACGLLSAGAAGDRFGRRRVFQIGLVVFGLGSLAAGLAPDLPSLVGFRMVQGLGAAMLPSSSLSIIANTFPDRKERARAMGTWGAISGLAVASGPLFGGVLVALAGWRSIFWINVPVIAVVLFLTRRYVLESAARTPRRLDLAGQVLAAGGLAALTGALIQAPARGWTSPSSLATFGVAVAALAGFLVLESRRREPMLALGFFADRAFSGTAAIASLTYFALNGFTFLTTLYLQNVRGDSPLTAGLSLLPATAVIAIAAPLSARLTAHHGPRRPALVATATMSAGLLLLTHATPHQGFALLALAYVGVGIGVGMVNPPVTTTAVSALPPSQAGVAAGVTGTARQVGGVFGVALLGSLVATARRTAGPSFIRASHVGFAIAAGAVTLAGLIALFTLAPREPGQPGNLDAG
jgi:EmrB/QacA subfamily drug resistance transporter